LIDLLWSDPTDNDQEFGIQSNFTRDPKSTRNIVRFGPDRVQQFLSVNALNLIIRSHECAMDGFERFAKGQLITVFSASDYCGVHKNAAAILVVQKNSEIIPKLIFPVDQPNKNWLEDDESLKKRPPTPPRSRTGATLLGASTNNTGAFLH
jgi:protein phosphatase